MELDIQEMHNRGNHVVLAAEKISEMLIRMKTEPSIWITTWITALTPIIWGSTFILASEILPADTPLTTAAIRMLPAGFAMILLTRSPRPYLSWPKLLILAFLNIAAFQALLFVAAQRLPGGIAAVVSSLQPLITIFLVWWVDSRKPHIITLFASLLGLAGMAGIFLSPASSFDPIGIIAAVGGSVCIAVGTFLAVRWRNNIPLLPFIGWKMAMGGLILLVPALVFEEDFPTLSLTQWFAYGYLTLIGTVLAYLIWFRGLSILPAVSVSALGLLSPLTAILLGWIFKNETLGLSQWIGIAVVLVSLVILQTSLPQKRPHPRPDQAKFKPFELQPSLPFSQTMNNMKTKTNMTNKHLLGVLLSTALLGTTAKSEPTDTLADKEGHIALHFSDGKKSVQGLDAVNHHLLKIGVRVSEVSIPEIAKLILHASQSRALTQEESARLLEIFKLGRRELVEEIAMAGRKPEMHRGGYLQTSETGIPPYPKVYDMKSLDPKITAYLQVKFGKLHVNSSEAGVGIEEVMTIVSGGPYTWFFVLEDGVVGKLRFGSVSGNKLAWRISYPGLVPHGGFFDAPHGLVVAYAHGPENFVMRYQDPSVKHSQTLNDNPWIDFSTNPPTLLTQPKISNKDRDSR